MCDAYHTVGDVELFANVYHVFATRGFAVPEDNGVGAFFSHFSVAQVSRFFAVGFPIGRHFDNVVPACFGVAFTELVCAFSSA